MQDMMFSREALRSIFRATAIGPLIIHFVPDLQLERTKREEDKETKFCKPLKQKYVDEAEKFIGKPIVGQIFISSLPNVAFAVNRSIIISL